jgi:hypothetical protein
MTDKSYTYYADFYVTCATVIPVLFLVVAVRAGKYESEVAEKRRNKKQSNGARPCWALPTPAWW